MWTLVYVRAALVSSPELITQETVTGEGADSVGADGVRATRRGEPGKHFIWILNSKSQSNPNQIPIWVLSPPKSNPSLESLILDFAIRLGYLGSVHSSMSRHFLSVPSPTHSRPPRQSSSPSQPNVSWPHLRWGIYCVNVFIVCEIVILLASQNPSSWR